MNKNTLKVGLCGLAYRAEVLKKRRKFYWKSYDEIALNVIAKENDWSLCGQIIAFQALRNPFSGNDLYWLYVDLGELKLEVLVNRRRFEGGKFTSRRIHQSRRLAARSYFERNQLCIPLMKALIGHIEQLIFGKN